MFKPSTRDVNYRTIKDESDHIRLLPEVLTLGTNVGNVDGGNILTAVSTGNNIRYISGNIIATDSVAVGETIALLPEEYSAYRDGIFAGVMLSGSTYSAFIVRITSGIYILAETIAAQDDVIDLSGIVYFSK